jgi:hypothetical protein
MMLFADSNRAAVKLEALEQAANARNNRWRHLDRAEAGDMLVPDPAADTAGLDEAHL